MQPQDAVVNRWRDAAPFWEKYRDAIRQMFAPVTEALIEEAAIGNGQTVLDIATGPGEPALTVAAAVGAEGKVVGIDLVEEMVAVARRAAARDGFGNAQFQVASAAPLPFPAENFDAVVSRFGIMFFPSPVDAVREMLRVLKPGRRLALAVWGSNETNPYFSVLSEVMDRYEDSPPPVSETPDQFRFAVPGTLRNVVAEAGAMAPAERALAFTIEVPLSAEGFWDLRVQMSQKLREMVAKLPADKVPLVKREAIEALERYATDRGLNLPAEIRIVSGTRSPSVG
jgi:ubiquinone/menaquinone biosynthesis C-methylase UbiE